MNDGAANSACTEATDTKTIRVNAQPYAEISGPRIHGREADTKFIVKNDFDSDNDELFFTWSGTGIIGSNKERNVIVNHTLQEIILSRLQLTIKREQQTPRIRQYSTIV